MKKLTKSEMLFTAISRMTSTQKKMFGLEMKKFTKSSHYVLMFDYFEKKKKYDSKKFEDFINQRNIPNHYSVVSYLLEKLVLFIYKTGSESTNSKILEELNYLKEKALAFAALGFLNEAIKAWKKMLKIADENEEYGYCMESFVYLYRFNQSAYLKKIKYKDKLKLNVYERAKKYGDQETYAKQLVILHFDVYSLRYAKKATSEDWAKLDKLNLLENPPPDSYRSNIFYYHSKGYYTSKVKGTKAAVVVFKEFKEKQRKFIGNRNINLEHIFNADYLYLLFFYWCDKPDEYITEANYFDGLMALYEKKIHINNKKKLQKMKLMFNLLNAIVQAKKLTLKRHYQIEDIRVLHEDKKWLKSNNNKLVQACALLIFGYLSILIKEYNEYNKYELLLKKYISELTDISYFNYDFELLQLIELYENNTSYYFNNQLKRFTKKIKAQNDYPPSILKMTDLLRKLSKSEQPEKLMKDSLEEIKSQEMKDASRSKVLPFYIWLRRRSEEL